MSLAADLDAIREAYAEWGFALYAYEPGGEVTLELLAPSGDRFEFHGVSVASVLRVAFPGFHPAAPEPAAPPDEEGDPFS